MDNTNTGTQQVRNGSHSSDDQIGGCCPVFNRALCRKANRRQLLQHVERKDVPRKAQVKGEDERNPEGEAPKSLEPISTLKPASMESPRAAPSPNSMDLESEEFQKIISSAIVELNATITQFCKTLREFGNTLEHDNGAYLNDSPLECKSLEEGTELVSQIILEVTENQKQISEAKGTRRGVLNTIGRGLMIICHGVKPTLKNFLLVAAQSSSVSVIYDYSESVLTCVNRFQSSIPMEYCTAEFLFLLLEGPYFEHKLIVPVNRTRFRASSGVCKSIEGHERSP